MYTFLNYDFIRIYAFKGLLDHMVALSFAFEGISIPAVTIYIPPIVWEGSLFLYILQHLLFVRFF